MKGMEDNAFGRKEVRELKDDVSVVNADGILIVAVGFGSYDEVTLRCNEPGLLRKVRAAADMGEMVEIIPLASRFQAGWNTPLEVLTAMMSAVPGRSVIVQTPKTVLEAMDSAANPVSGSHRIY